MDPETFAEQVRSKAEEHSLHLIPISSTRLEGFSVEPENVDEVITFAKKHDLPLLLNEKLDQDVYTQHTHLFVQGPYTNFQVKVTSN